jgi:hypothetical protein
VAIIEDGKELLFSLLNTQFAGQAGFMKHIVKKRGYFIFVTLELFGKEINKLLKRYG